MCIKVTDLVEAQDYFANKVTLTQGGVKDYQSKLGGCVSILTFLSVFVYGAMQIEDLYFHPVYNSYPVLYDYNYDKTVKWDLNSNMPSYRLADTSQNLLKTLRVVFSD